MELMRVIIVDYVCVRKIIANLFDRSRRVEVEFIANISEATVPRSIAKKLDLKVVDKRRFGIASGEVVEYTVSEARCR